jgi:hypothetical protein
LLALTPLLTPWGALAVVGWAWAACRAVLRHRRPALSQGTRALLGKDTDS